MDRYLNLCGARNKYGHFNYKKTWVPRIDDESNWKSRQLAQKVDNVKCDRSAFS